MTTNSGTQLSIVAQSQTVLTSTTPALIPQITLGSLTLTLGSVPTSFSGFQVVVIDTASGSITDPSNVRLNQFFAINPDVNMPKTWMTTFQFTYDTIQRAILASGDPNDFLLLLVSFGLDANMAPTTEVLEFLFSVGAGPMLQNWLQQCDFGSQGGGWVGLPANYILVGYADAGYGGAAKEMFAPGTWGPNNPPLVTSVNEPLRDQIAPGA